LLADDRVHTRLRGTEGYLRICAEQHCGRVTAPCLEFSKSLQSIAVPEPKVEHQNVHCRSCRVLSAFVARRVYPHNVRPTLRAEVRHEKVSGGAVILQNGDSRYPGRPNAQEAGSQGRGPSRRRCSSGVLDPSRAISQAARKAGKGTESMPARQARTLPATREDRSSTSPRRHASSRSESPVRSATKQNSSASRRRHGPTTGSTARWPRRDGVLTNLTLAAQPELHLNAAPAVPGLMLERAV
jgi:hypothetical protein